MSAKLKIKGDVMKVGYGSLSIFKSLSANIRRAGYKDGTCTQEGANEGEAVKVVSVL